MEKFIYFSNSTQNVKLTNKTFNLFSLRQPIPKIRSESNDLRNAFWSPDLNQMICDLCSKVLIWIKWFVICALKSWSESNDLRYAFWSPDLNQMICDLCSKVLIWIKWFTIRILKSRSESNDLRYSFWSPDLNQMICDTHSEVPIWIKWFAILILKSWSESNDLWTDLKICESFYDVTDSELWKADNWVNVKLLIKEVYLRHNLYK